MSATLATTASNVRELIGDQDVNATFLDDLELYHLIISKAMEMAIAPLMLGHDWITGAFTLIPGSTADYDLPTSVEYAQVLKLRIAATGYEIPKVDWDEIEWRREGITATSGNGGDPTAFALRMDESNAVTVRIDTVPSEARSIDLLRSALPGSTYTDATSIPFGAPGLRALELLCAARIIRRMPDDAMGQRKLTPKTIDDYEGSGQQLKLEEQARVHRLTAAPRIVGAWR